jgi:hypothetical protein
MTRILTLFAALLIVLALFLMFREEAPNYSKPVPGAVDKQNDQPETVDTDFHTWNEFSPENGLFKVLLPATPQYVSDMVIDPKTLEPRKYETYALAANNGVGYIINVISLPPSSKLDEESLKTAVTDMLERNKENKLKQMKMGVFREKPALDFSLGNKDVLIEGKVMAHDNKIYILSMIGKEDSFDKKNFDFFINSFHFTEEKK